MPPWRHQADPPTVTTAVVGDPPTVQDVEETKDEVPPWHDQAVPPTLTMVLCARGMVVGMQDNEQDKAMTAVGEPTTFHLLVLGMVLGMQDNVLLGMVLGMQDNKQGEDPEQLVLVVLVVGGLVILVVGGIMEEEEQQQANHGSMHQACRSLLDHSTGLLN